jgi:isocitrate dehydrogenase
MLFFYRTGVYFDAGPITIPGGGKGNVTMRGEKFTSANQAMRRLFGLYANVRPVMTKITITSYTYRYNPATTT